MVNRHWLIAQCIITGDFVDKKDSENHDMVRSYEKTTYYFSCTTCMNDFEDDPKKFTTKTT